VTELGAFLRARREATAPADVGLRPGPRRRTPGLRRAEVATLAGVSVDYLTRIEQGRDRHPSPQILGALADALRFSAADRAQLRMLIFREKESALCPAADRVPDRAITPTVRAVLERLDPAVVLNRLGDVLAHTSGFARVAGPIGLLADGNLLRYLFTDPAARAAFPDWERMADHHVAQLKGDTHRSDPHVAGLADELAITAGAPFTDRFAALTQLPARFGTERWAHPVAGQLSLRYETLTFPDSADLRIVTYLPADERTADALAGLVERPALRAVT
jgi:transcriptional regulator with XRE-family HTH domain